MLDSLDQLSDEYNGRRLEWLPPQPRLPQGVTVVVTTLGNVGGCLRALHTTVAPPEHSGYVSVAPLGREDVAEIVDEYLQRDHRRLTPEQRDWVAGGEANPSALLLRIRYHASRLWPSYHSVAQANAPKSARAAIELFFSELDQEFSQVVIANVLGFVTLARDGLSRMELEDLLSSSDTVLTQVFEWWLPPIVRMPPLIVTRILSAVSEFVVWRAYGSTKTLLVRWFHRQFWEAVEGRYLNDADKKCELHSELADYFSGRWSSGKPFTPPSRFSGSYCSPQRQLPSQSLLLEREGTDHLIPNTRRLRELVHHFLGANRVADAANQLCSIEYVRAMFEADLASELFDQYGKVLHSLEAFADPPVPPAQVQSWFSFFQAHQTFLKANESRMVYHIALAHAPEGSDVEIAARRALSRDRAMAWSAVGKSTEFDPCLAVIVGHTTQVRGAAYSPDGRCIVSWANDRTVRLWDPVTGAELFKLEGHTAPVRYCVISRDNRVASASNDMTVKIWSAETGELLRTFEGHTDMVRACDLSADGAWLVSGSEDKTLRVWNTATGECKHVLQGHEAGVTSCAWSPSGTHAVSGSDDRSLRVWDTATGELLHTLKGHTHKVRCCAFSPDSKHIASGAQDNTVRIWSTDSANPLITMKGHTNRVLSCCFSPDGSRVLSSGYDQTVRLWDASSGKQLRSLEGHTDRVDCARFSPDGSRIVSGSNDGTVRVWRADGGDTGQPGAHTGAVTSCAFSPDGSLLATGGSDKTVRVWATDSCRLLHVLKGHAGKVVRIWFTSDGQHIVSKGAKDSHVWDAKTGRDVTAERANDAASPPAASMTSNDKISISFEDRTLKIEFVDEVTPPVELWEAADIWCGEVTADHQIALGLGNGMVVTLRAIGFSL
eukprot:c26603_g1_i1.p1 GENE.c26603_g1_i1~~c26603_g1_i1.p1  ORF type:complete len:914 (+),score=184.29 c26603_g1_i1:76-2742(+)